MSKLRDKKEALYNSKAFKGPHKIVDLGPVEVEVRPPRVGTTIKNLSALDKNVSVEDEPSIRDLLLDCVYDPDTGAQFFEVEDLEKLENASMHGEGVINQITNAIAELSVGILQEDQEEVEGN